MAEAEVGDDVFGDDPTVNRLQARVAALFGKEAALFVPSGTMANQISIRAHTEPGDEIICHEASHVYQYEGGAACALAGCSVRLVPGGRGMFTDDQVRDAVRRVDDHYPHSALVVVENTHNRGGGSVWPVAAVAQVSRVARELGLQMHLDGARLLNACIASGISAAEYARHFDSATLCFSKGLGAPVGSAVAGDREFITRAKRFRKMYGGGMRQAGVLAAAALYALDHHVDRLAEDHANAKRLAEGLATIDGLVVDTPETNIVYADVDPEYGTAADWQQQALSAGVRIHAVGPRRFRAVTHLDVAESDIDRAVATLRKCSKLRE